MEAFPRTPGPASRPDNPPRVPESHESAETAHALIDAISAAPGFTAIDYQTQLLSSLPDESLVVRREDPDKIRDLFGNGEVVELSFVGGSPYANSVTWNPKLDRSRGLDNAFLEGYGHKDHIVTVYGFRKPEGFFLERPDDSQRVFAGVDRSRVRAAAGFVPLDAVQFVVVRIPIMALEEAELTEREKDARYDYLEAPPSSRVPAYAYRAFVRAPEEGTETLH